MKIASFDTFPVSVPYRQREVSSQVERDGVTDVLVRLETDDGLVGWGEACSGADTASVDAALRAMAPFVLGQDPWNKEAIGLEVYSHGLWQFHGGTGNFAFAGIDMAMWDLCARAAGQPLYRLFGGAVRHEVTYFYYLKRGPAHELHEQCRAGLAMGHDVFYLKVGIDDQSDLATVVTVRESLGPSPRLRLDANGAWSLPQARRMLDQLAPYDIDFIEQPVRDHPVGHLAEIRARSPIRVCANEGLWSTAQAFTRIVARQADVYCFSPYWVGSLAGFHRLSHVAHLEGLQVCKHTHGELGIAAAAAHHLLLTLPNVVDGNQQTAESIASDILTEPLPIATCATWSLPPGPGLGVDIDEDAVAAAAETFQRDGQFLPYQPSRLASTRCPAVIR